MGIAAILIALGLLIFFSHVLNALFSKIRISNVLVLILFGLVAGPLTGWFKPSILGEFGSVFTTITLIVILFESGTSLDLEALKKSILGASLLTLLNFLISLLMGYLLGRFVLNLENLHSLFLGAALGGTSSAVVIPMIRQLKAGPKAETSLYIESALSDVFCLVVALALLGGIKTGEISVVGILKNMSVSFLFAIMLGLGAGFVWMVILRKWLANMSNTMFTTFALAFILYGLSESIGLNGGICILSFGIMAGNIGNTQIMKKIVLGKRDSIQDLDLNQTERQFYSEIVFIFQTYFFFYIGISIQLNNLWHILAGLILIAGIFLTRPFTALSLGRKGISLRDRKLVAALGPRGLVAAVLASLPLQNAMSEQLAAGSDVVYLSLAETLIRNGQTIQNVSYALVLISIILSSVWVWIIDLKKSAQNGSFTLPQDTTSEPEKMKS